MIDHNKPVKNKLKIKQLPTLFDQFNHTPLAAGAPVQLPTPLPNLSIGGKTHPYEGYDS